jgi:phthalate 4,5-dioxygenase oxygenase subunit
MLTQVQNDLLTLTGPGAPGGDMLRRYWQPVALASELDADVPKPVRILSEDMVLFRDASGAPAMIDLHCPHRGADMSYGRVEDNGLRCVYHGWLFGKHGQCLEQPGEPPEKNFKDRLRSRSYPCIEAGGLVLTYMGPGEPPAPPKLPFFDAPGNHVWNAKLLHECNYLQGLEGNVDPQHVSFLHRLDSGMATRPKVAQMMAGDVAPELEAEETSYGLRIYATRSADPGTKYVRVTNFIMPNCSNFDGEPKVDPKKVTPVPNEGFQVHWHVPIDDTHHWKYIVIYRYNGPVDGEYLDNLLLSETEAPFELKRNARNRYLQSRDELRAATYVGMGHNFQAHDRFAVESQRPISDRTQEHLGTTDRALIAMRKQLLAAVDDVQSGRDPLFVNHDTAQNPLSEMIVRAQQIPAETPVKNFWKVEALS